MADDADQVTLLRDADHFLDRRDHADVVVTLVADVARIHTTELPRDRGERDHFFSLGITARRVEEPARETVGALLHRAPHERAHLLELLSRRRAILAADHASAHAAVTDQQRDVRSDAALLEFEPLCGEVDGTAAVRVDDDRRHTLRKNRLCLSKLRSAQAFAGM